jgi:glycerol-3-phosphate dehydrogenase
MKAVEDNFDVIIIGAGIAGACVARELSKYKLSVAILEKETDVCFGATKASHAIVHCGMPSEGTPLKNEGMLNGNLMMGELCAELDVSFKRIGKLLVAHDENEKSMLKKLLSDCKQSGVLGTEIIEDKQRIRDMEPYIANDIIAALYTPSTGIANPWSLVIGLIENAVHNGVELYLNTDVTSIRAGEKKIFEIKTQNSVFRSSFIVNAAGAYADKVARMIGDDSFRISGTRHQRIIMDKQYGNTVKHLVREFKGSKPTGAFVMPTIDGNIMVGNAEDRVEDPNDVKTTNEGVKKIVIPQYQRLVSSIPPGYAIRPFAGIIPTAGPEYHIKPAPDFSKFINFVLGGSGFTSAPAMGRYVVENLLDASGLKLKQKDDFIPYRKEMAHFNHLSDEERSKFVEANSLNGKIICRCEMVSEGEILAVIDRGANTKDGIKFRTRAGMGRCQGNFCSHKVLDIMSRKIEKTNNMGLTKKGGFSEELY